MWSVHRESVDGLVVAKNLDADTEKYFETLKFKKSLAHVRWTERDIIENRLKRKLSNDNKICQKHRFELGIQWRPPKQCAHPNHPPKKSGQKACATSLAPLWLVNQVNIEKEFTYTLGGKICYKHLQFETQKRKQQAIERENEQENLAGFVENTNLDTSFYEPEQPSVSPGVQSSSKEIGSQITNYLDRSPINFQITKKLDLRKQITLT